VPDGSRRALTGMHDTLIILSALLAPLGALQEAPDPLALDAVIELPGVEGRIDHPALDGARERLYVAALGNDSVEAVDLKVGKRVRSVRGVPAAQGILYLPDRDCTVVTSGGAGTGEVFDGDTLLKAPD